MPANKPLSGESLRAIFQCLRDNHVDQSASIRFLLQLAGHNLLSASRRAGMHDCSAYRNIRQKRMPLALVEALSDLLGFELQSVAPDIVDNRRAHKAPRKALTPVSLTANPAHPTEETASRSTPS